MTGRGLKTREIAAISRATRAIDGRDFHTRRARVPPSEPGGPLVFIDEIGPVDLVAGEAWKPRTVRHRNVQSLTCVLEGQWDCSDAEGSRSTLRSGDVCWRVAQGEAMRTEGPSAEMLRVGGRLHCLEVCLRRSVTAEARHEYRWARAETIPQTKGPASVRVLLGSLMSTRGAFDPGGSLAIADWLVSSGASVSFRVAEPLSAFLYVHQDVVWIGAEDLALREGQLAVLGPGDEVVLRGPESSLRPARVLFLAGQSPSVPGRRPRPDRDEKL